MVSLTFKKVHKVSLHIWKKITYTLNYHYCHHSKRNCTLTATKGFVFKEGGKKGGQRRGTRDKLTKTNLVRSIGDMLMRETAVIFEPEDKHNHFVFEHRCSNQFHKCQGFS